MKQRPPVKGHEHLHFGEFKDGLRVDRVGRLAEPAVPASISTTANRTRQSSPPLIVTNGGVGQASTSVVMLNQKNQQLTLAVVGGQGHSRSIPFYLHQSFEVRSPKPIEEVTKYYPIFETLIRQDSVEILVEKLCLVDLLTNSSTHKTLNKDNIT